MNGWEVVRAKDHESGDHYTTTRHLAAKRGDEVIEDHPAVDKHGAWLPRKPHITRGRDERGRFTTTSEEEA